MSSIMKVFLLLAVMICITKAQLYESRQCLCHRVRKANGMKSEVKDVQIYPATIFCDKVEIVVTLNSGLRYCLNPNLSQVKKMVANIISRKQKSSTVRPAELTSTSSSTNTARI